MKNEKNEKKHGKTLTLSAETIKNLNVRSAVRAGVIHSSPWVRCTSGPNQM